MSTETPRECIKFSAYLRGGGSTAERAELVDRIVDTLGLERCADTIVGSALLKGISGGEKKRVSVAIELITDPMLLFLDEPLSGLDAYAAFTVTKMLKDGARRLRPVAREGGQQIGGQPTPRTHHRACSVPRAEPCRLRRRASPPQSPLRHALADALLL